MLLIILFSVYIIGTLKKCEDDPFGRFPSLTNVVGWKEEKRKENEQNNYIKAIDFIGQWHEKPVLKQLIYRYDKSVKKRIIYLNNINVENTRSVRIKINIIDTNATCNQRLVIRE